MMNHFHSLFAKHLPDRTTCPRTNGLTMVIDRKLGPLGLRDFCDLNLNHFDLWKLGFGTAVITSSSVLEQKLEILKAQKKIVFCGGTLFEFAGQWKCINDYIETCRKIGFNAIEISDGTIEIAEALRRNSILRAKDAGFLVLTEVGSKDPTKQESAEILSIAILNDIKNGADFVIMEGRESGKSIGMYDQNGRVLEEYFSELIKNLSPEILTRVIWEAPQTQQQIYLIHKFGSNVNLGNINPDDVMGLEALRMGLRWDTFVK